MTVSILDPGPLGILLGSLLHLKGVPVSLPPRACVARGGRIRVTLPDGRLLVEGFGTGTATASAEFLLVSQGQGGPDRDLRRSLSGQARGRQEVRGAVINGCWDGADPELGTWETCLVLADPVMLDPACVELPEPGAAILTPRGSRIARLLEPLRSFGFSCHETDGIGACLNSYRVARLLDLPVALCNTTRAHFLSHPEGRQIAIHVLDEGLRALRKLGEKPGRLPSGDPTELLRRMGRAPRAFDAARFLPDRGYNPTLQCLMRGETPDPKCHNRRIVERAAGAGLTLEWNWKLSQKLARIPAAGFFSGPAELLAAIG